MRSFSSVSTALLVLHLALSVSCLSSSTLHFGRCPTMKVQQDFDASAYMGVWYELAHYNTAQYEGSNPRCVTATYGLNTTSGVVSVENVAIDSDSGYEISISGSAVLDDSSKDEGKLTVTFNIDGYDVEGMYWVLGTDYEIYSVVYACTNYRYIFHYYTVWYLGRSQTFASDADETAYFSDTDAVLKSHGLKASIMSTTSQSNCTSTTVDALDN